MSESQGATRYHGLDGLRAFAMLLGVFLHAAIPYIHIPFPWAVADSSRSFGLTMVIYTIHSFRMPAFFLIAGFFARLVHHRKGTASFLRHRAKRVLLPFVVGWCTLYPITRALWVWSGVRSIPGSSTSDFWLALSVAFSPKYLLRGLGLIHLWFLYYLLLLYLVFLISRWFFLRFIDRKQTLQTCLDNGFSKLLQSPWAAFGIAIPFTLVMFLMQGWGVDFVNRSLFPRLVHILYYGAFFFTGWMLHRNPGLLSSLRKRWRIHLGVGLSLLFPLSYLLYLVFHLKYDADAWFRALYFLLYGGLSWSLVLALIGIFENYFNRPSRRWRYLADASYWVYLVHLPLVIAFPVLLRGMPFSWVFKLILVLSASIPILLGSYHLCVRSTWIGVILNGRRFPLKLPKMGS